MKRAFEVLVLCGAVAACGTSSSNSQTAGDAGPPKGDASIPQGDDAAAPDAGGDAAPVTCAVVTTSDGPVQPSTPVAPCTFMGIPYAAPPTGALRWKAPQPAATWTAPRASAAGSGCPQVASEFGTASTDEDCLYLNVWSPNTAAATPAPVMVFVHGGSFLYGSGSFGYYDGTNLAAATGHVIVTINYRLGAFGFLSTPELRAEDPASPSSGEYGIQDQIAAFQWVQKNISAFGGDAKNVTIFGESAGGTSMFLHIASPKSTGLFQHVIAESGAGAGSLAVPMADGDANGAAFATALGCNDQDAGTVIDAGTSLACLRGKAASDVLTAAEGPTSTFYWWPSVDGFVLPSDPSALFAAGTFNKVPTMLGTNKNEGTIFVDPAPPTDPTSYLAFADGLLPGQGPAIVAQYPIASYNGSYSAAASEAMTDGTFVCPTRRVARAIVATGTPVFRYEFVHAMEDPPIPNLGVFHGSELAFVLGNPIAGVFGLKDDEVPLSTLMMAYWGSMATSGTPNGSSRFAWPAYDATTEPDLVLDTTQSTDTQFKKAACDFWDALPL